MVSVTTVIVINLLYVIQLTDTGGITGSENTIINASGINSILESDEYIEYQNDSFPVNYSMNHIWRRNFISKSFTRIYISDQCKFIYFTTLKTASKTTREMIDLKQCGFGVNFYDNGKWWRRCGDHDCNSSDYMKMNSSEYFSMIFIRNPIDRFESLYNFLGTGTPMKYKQKSKNPLGISSQSIPIKELQFLRFIDYFHDSVMGQRNQSWIELGRMRTDHLQPLSLYPCHAANSGKVSCFVPSFVGRVETLLDDMHWLEENEKLGRDTVINQSVYRLEHKTSRNKCPRGTIYKYNEALEVICKIYWNDFHCGHYQIPDSCRRKNRETWHFPTYCVDLNDNQVSWPSTH